MTSKPNQTEYIRYYHLARNHTKDESLFPNISDSEIAKNISKENWLMLIKDPYKDKLHAASSSEPNVYLEIKDNRLRIGLTFNTIGAIEKFLNLSNDYSGVEFHNIVTQLLNLNNTYQTFVSRKIKEYYGPSPKYKDEFDVQTNKLNKSEFKKIIELCAKIRLEGKEHQKLAKHKSYTETPTIDLVRTTVPCDETSFYFALDDTLSIYKSCMNLKTDKNIVDIALLDKIKQIPDWEWYLECDRNGLVELLKEKFNVDISTSKLTKFRSKKSDSK